MKNAPFSPFCEDDRELYSIVRAVGVVVRSSRLELFEGVWGDSRGNLEPSRRVHSRSVDSLRVFCAGPVKVETRAMCRAILDAKAVEHTIAGDDYSTLMPFPIFCHAWVTRYQVRAGCALIFAVFLMVCTSIRTLFKLM